MSELYYRPYPELTEVKMRSDDFGAYVNLYQIQIANTYLSDEGILC